MNLASNAESPKADAIAGTPSSTVAMKLIDEAFAGVGPASMKFKGPKDCNEPSALLFGKKSGTHDNNKHAALESESWP